ncbi:MAG: DUF7305 domain-containing protein [Planctomycetota bacterium]|jgi:hypothetical protein
MITGVKVMGKINRKTGRRGAALLIVLFIVMAVTIMSLSFLTRSDAELSSGQGMISHSQMNYLAESGVEHARGLILNPSGVDMGGLGYWPGATRQQITSGNDYYDVNVVLDAAYPSTGLKYDITCVAYREKNGVKTLGSTLAASLKVNVSEPGISVWDRIIVRENGRLDGVSGKAVISTNSILPGKIRVKDDGIINGHCYAGPGGTPSVVIVTDDPNQITGRRSALNEVVDIPSLSAPIMPPTVGDRFYKSGTTTLTSDLHCNRFEIKGTAIVNIAGNITILADDNFKVKDDGQLRLRGGAMLTVYTKKLFVTGLNAKVNVNTADASRFILNHMGLGVDCIKLSDFSRVYAVVTAPDTALELHDDSNFYGTFKGKEVQVNQRGQIHMVPSKVASSK